MKPTLKNKPHVQQLKCLKNCALIAFAARRDRDAMPTTGLLLGRGQLVIREAEVLATHQSEPGLRLQSHCRVNRSGFLVFP